MMTTQTADALIAHVGDVETLAVKLASELASYDALFRDAHRATLRRPG